jgi:hypothetical protein
MEVVKSRYLVKKNMTRTRVLPSLEMDYRATLSKMPWQLTMTLMAIYLKSKMFMRLLMDWTVKIIQMTQTLND